MNSTIKDAFLVCLDMPGPDRERYLRDLDDDTRSEVEQLLLAHEGSDGLFESPPMDLDELPPRPETSELRRRIGPFLVGDVLGRGGMGVVYRAEQDLPRREVALKVLTALDDEDRRRFVVEAEALARIEHTAITRIFEAGEIAHEGSTLPYIAMEFVEGERLQRWLMAAKPSPSAVLSLMASIAEGVHHAHTCGIIHRDLKPSNVLVTTKGQPKIIDFGVARIESASRDLTMDGAVLGTLAYMSPEQAGGRARLIDARCDQYALGVMTYEALTGRLPVAVRGLPLLEAARAIQERTPDPLDLKGFDLTDDLELVLGRTLAKDPTARYPSTAALADDFRRLARGEPIAAATSSTMLSLRAIVRRHRITALTMMGIVLLLAGSSVLQWRTNRRLSRAEEETTRALAEERRSFKRLETSLASQAQALEGERKAREQLDESLRTLEEQKSQAIELKTAALAERDRALAIEVAVETVLFGTLNRDGGLASDMPVGKLIQLAELRLDGLAQASPSARASCCYMIGSLLLATGDASLAARRFESALGALKTLPGDALAAADHIQITRSHAGRVECFQRLGQKTRRNAELDRMKSSLEQIGGDERYYWEAEFRLIEAKLLLGDGEPKKALASLTAAANSLDKIDPDRVSSEATPFAHLQIASLMLDGGDAEAAHARLIGPAREFVERWPESTSTLTHLALLVRVELARGVKHSAFDVGQKLHAALNGDPKPSPIAELRGREALAMALRQGMPGLDPVQNQRRVVELARLKGRAERVSMNLTNLAVLLMESGAVDEALKLATEATELVEDLPTRSARLARARALDRRLGCLLAKQEWTQGLETANRLVGLNRSLLGATAQNTITARIYEGYCLAKVGKRADALKKLESVESDARKVGDRGALQQVAGLLRSLRQKK